MYFLSIISASLLTNTALAAPGPLSDTTVTTNTISEQIDVRQDADFLGLKFTGSAELGECKNFPHDFTDNITSCKSKPDFSCTIWVNKECKGTGLSFNSKGTKQLPDWIDEKSKSWKGVDANS